jgi:hypothetical protein
MAFTQYVKVRRMISEIATEPPQSFWSMNLNLLIDAAAIEWAKVFGSRSDDRIGHGSYRQRSMQTSADLCRQCGSRIRTDRSQLDDMHTSAEAADVQARDIP